jgi:GNAT superfamily N-acetyltransferase
VTANLPDQYAFTLQQETSDAFKRYLQGILNQYHESAYPRMRVPESKQFVIRVHDPKGKVVGGAILYAYWGWLEISLLALEAEARGQGLGRRLMARIEDLARREGCTRIRTESFEREAFGFYRKLGYQIVGHLQDYPEGYSYYWLRKDLSTVREPETDEL